jgi:hypothetical protein
MSKRSIHAVVRFGLGQRGLEPLPTDPEAWLAAQLDAADLLLTSYGPDAMSAFNVWHLEDVGNIQFGKGLATQQPHFIGDRYQSDRRWAMHALISSSQPFRERLVTFWANHFTVSARAGGGVLALVGAFVQEAIRPHITGSFDEMLSAAFHHPGMLYYLNNEDSIGPNSESAGVIGRGLNAPRSALNYKGLKARPLLVAHQTTNQDSLLESYLESEITPVENPLCQHILVAFVFDD